MKFGLNVVPVRPTDLTAVAVRAETLGFESLWVGEHVVVPYESSGGYPGGEPPFRPDSHFVEPFVAMAHLAAVTTTMRIGTGVAIFPLRAPLLLARAIATVDVLSGGRVSLGIGVGWLRDEFDIVGAPWDRRGARLDEMLGVLDVLWNEARPSFRGEFFDVPETGFEPKPVQRPHPPYLIGGSSPAALERAARLGDGWYGGMEEPAVAAEIVAGINGRRRELGRDGPFEVTLLTSWSAGFDAELVSAYEDAGVDRVVVTPWTRSSKALEGIERFAADAGIQSEHAA